MITLFLVVTLAQVGCAQAAGTESTETTVAPETTAAESTTVSETEATETTAVAGKTIKVGWLSYNISDDWFASVNEFGQQEAKVIEQEEGVKFEFDIKDAGADAETQVKQVDDLITVGDIDMLLFEAVDEKAMAKAITKVNEELNIPVGSAGTPAAGGKFIYVGLDNVKATEQCGDYLAKLLNEKYGEPAKWGGDDGGIIIEIWGPPGLQITKDRHTGFRNKIDPLLKQNPKVKIVEGTSNWNPDTAFKVISDLVQRYGDEIIGIYTDDDTSATEGAWRALELAGLAYPVGDPKHIPIVTYDGTMKGMQAVREKKIDMITEQPAIAYGRIAMRYLYQWYKEGYESLPQPGTVLTLDDLSKYFDPETTGAKYWAPVEVLKGVNFDGIWFAPKSAIIPDELDPYEKNQWGNYNYFKKYGEYPTK